MKCEKNKDMYLVQDDNLYENSNDRELTEEEKKEYEELKKKYGIK